MKAISKAGLVTLTALLTTFSPSASQAQGFSEMVNTCNVNEVVEDFLTTTPESFLTQPCLKSVVETIYDPIPTRQPQL